MEIETIRTKYYELLESDKSTTKSFIELGEWIEEQHTKQKQETIKFLEEDIKKREQIMKTLKDEVNK